MDDLKSEIRRQLSDQKLLNREVVAKISITDKDVTDFYKQNRAQFNVAEPQYRIAQIVVTPHPDPSVHNRKNDKATTETEARQKIGILEQKLKVGLDFTQLAMDYSEDTSSSTGWRSRFYSRVGAQQSDPVLKKTVLAMKPGEVHTADPVKGGVIAS